MVLKIVLLCSYVHEYVHVVYTLHYIEPLYNFIILLRRIQSSGDGNCLFTSIAFVFVQRILLLEHI